MEIILGVFASGITQWAKNHFGTKGVGTLVFLAFVALVAAFLFQYVVAIGYWELVAKVLVTAGSFYTFIIRRFE